MGRGFRIGSILGLEISIDLSWLVILALVVWSFTTGVFPAVVPDLPAGAYLVMGIAGAALFFGSLLLHELAHSVVARAKGIEVEGITLFVFGGVSRMRTEAGSPEDEFVIAGVGPLTSLALAGAFLALSVLGGGAGLGTPAVVVARYLSFLNLALAVFNLLPGFPLDGGRLFRAAVWRLTGDLDRATRWATTGGRAMGMLFIFLGLWQAFSGNVLGGLWIVFIGWFLGGAAQMSYRQHVLQAGLEGATARDGMTRNPLTVPPETGLREFVDEYVLHGPHRSYPVTDGGQILGLITLGRVLEEDRERWPELTVRDVLIEVDDRTSVAPEESLVEVLRRLHGGPVDRLLVVEGEKLIGVVTSDDVIEWLALASGTLQREDATGLVGGRSHSSRGRAAPS